MALDTAQDAIAFYDNRYEQGYMADWPKELKQRLAGVVRDCPLPASGRCLDYGCGNGVLTAVLKQVLPRWEVYGADISSVAMDNARKRFPNCQFVDMEPLRDGEDRFDLVFSHHVLEHVLDIQQTWAELAALTSPAGWMLHVLPCGNGGSFEHWLCSLRREGVETSRQGRFFFEEEGHLRRLDTRSMTSLAARHGFQLVHQRYRNQYFGAIEWITESSPQFIRQLTSTDQCLGSQSSRQLRSWRTLLLLIHRLRTFARSPLTPGWGKRCTDYFRLALFPLGYPVERYIRHQARREWNERGHEPGGSEMYLLFHHDPEQFLER